VVDFFFILAYPDIERDMRMDFTSLDLTTAVIFVAIALVVGFFMGLLAGGPRSRDDEPSKAEKGIDPNWVDVARFWWDRRNNDMVLRTGERTYLKGAKIKSAERKRIARILQELYNWVAQEPLPDVDPVFTLRDAVYSMPEDRPQAMLLNPVDSIAKALQADVPQSTADPHNIAELINEVLQEKLKKSHLKDRGIRLMEFPGKGMVVLVGLDQYDGIDDVPDVEIRSVLQEAVVDWEARTSVE
jgi:RNase P protein component